MTEQRLGFFEVVAFIYLCVYVQFVRARVQRGYVFVMMTVGEAGIYTKNTFFLEMPNLSPV